MDLRNRKKIIPPPANCNGLGNNSGDQPSTAAQRRLGLALARTNLVRGKLEHVSVPVRRILARIASRVQD